MTDLSPESLDQQLLKIQSAKDHLLRTKELFEEFGGAELKAVEANFAAMLDALNADLAEAERQRALQQAKTLAQHKQRLQGELEQARAQLAEAQAEVARLQQHSTAQTEAQAQKLRETEQEAELLLAQLHQVQEELESTYLKAQADKSAAEQQLAQLNAQLQQEQSAKSAAEQNAAQQAAKLTAELEQTRAAKAAAKQNAAQQVAQLTAELEQTRAAKSAVEQHAAQQAAQLQAELEQTRAAKAAAEQQAAQQAAQLTAELEQTRAAKAAAEQHAARQAEQVQKQLEESQQDSELLLLQLHQVQEELEQHFLENQKLQHECETLQQRWARLERRLPGYLDYELIEPVAVDAVSDQPRVDWRAVNITVAGQLHPEMAFSTVLQDGQTGIVLDGIELFPRALRGPDAAQAITQFRRFGSRQWGRVLAAATALEQFFAGEAAAEPSLSFDPVFWRQALLPLVAELRALPAVFRFDGVTLKRELINPDYEHLWLVLEGASLGQQHWPKFELRLGAADIKSGRFSRHPKLEFPLIDGKTRPFDSWYEESHDDFGGKFELRFDIDRKLMDIGVWAKLSVDDRKLLLSVNGVLGQALQQLQDDKCAISRAWSDWQGLAVGIIQTVQRLSEASSRQKVQPPASVLTTVNQLAGALAPAIRKVPTNKASSKPAAGKLASAKKSTEG